MELEGRHVTISGCEKQQGIDRHPLWRPSRGVSHRERVVLSRMERIRRGLSVDDDAKIGSLAGDRGADLAGVRRFGWLVKS
jgi:hypothetical protein